MSNNYLQRTWRFLAVLYASLLIHLLYYLSKETRSLSFRILAIGLAGFALGMVILSLRLSPDRITLLRRHLAQIRWPLVVSGVIVLFLAGINIRPEWIYPHMILTFAFTCVLMFWTLAPTPETLRVSPPLVAGGLLVLLAVLGIRIYGLAVYPPVNVEDEPIHLSWLVSYNKIGELTDWLYLGGEGFEGKTYIWIPRYYIPFAYWAKLVGVGLWQARLYTFILTLVTAIVTGRAARNLYDSTTGLFTIGALFASATLMVGARIRHDIGLALGIAMSLLLFSEAIRRDNLLLHLLAGTVMGVSMIAHLHASGLGIVMAISLYTPRYWQRYPKRWQAWIREIMLYGVGGLLGMLIGLVIQAGPKFWVFFDTRNPRNPHTLSEFLNAVHDHIANIAHFSQLELALIGLGIVAAVWRRRGFDASLILLAVLSPIALGLMASVAWDQLVVPIIPIGGIAIGALFGRGLRHAPVSSSLHTHKVVAFVLLLVPQLGVTLHTPLNHLISHKPLYPPPPPGVQWVLDHLEPGSTVSGENYHYFWLTDYRFVAPRTPSHMHPAERQKYGGGSLEAVWDAIGVDAFIFDPSVATYGMLVPLERDGYLESRGYKLAGAFPYNRKTMRVFVRPE